MNVHARSHWLLPAINVCVLSTAYAALFTTPHFTASYRTALFAGGVLAAAVVALTVAPAARAWSLGSPESMFLRGALAVVPWVALVGIIASRGLWWVQRPAVLRFFATYALSNWSVIWCLDRRPSGIFAWEPGARRAVAILAIALGLLGIGGAAFGVTPYGCGISAVLASAAALAYAVASMGSRSACLKTFAASAATLVAVASMETAVRALHIGHNVEEIESREYARQFYSLTPPGAAFVNAPNTLDEFGPALVSINSRGMRGPELADSHPDILLIGDSMVEARQLPWDRTVGPRLQQTLRERGSRLRVAAHGMRGWSPLLEWNWYLKVGRTLHPRVVMLFFFWNDLWTEGTEASTFSAELRPDGRPDHFNVPVDSNWIWYKHVRVIRLATDVWHRLSIAAVRRAFTSMAARKGSAGTLDDARAQQLARTLTEPPLTAAEVHALLTQPEDELSPDLRAMSRKSLWPGMRPLSVWTAAQRSASAVTEVELHRFAEDVAADGGRLVIVYVPNPMQVAAGECTVGRLFERIDTGVTLPPDSGIQRWLQDVAERQHIDLLDPSEAMRQVERTRSDGSPPLYLRADCHWSERGHDFMAAYLADWVERNHGAGE